MKIILFKCCPQPPNCKLPKLIIRHNIGPISTTNSRLLLLGQCRRLHRSSAEPTTAVFVDYLNLQILSRNLAQYRPYTKPIATFTMASSSESRRARFRPMAEHYCTMCHFYHGKPFRKWENQSSAQHWLVVVPKTSVDELALCSLSMHQSIVVYQHEQVISHTPAKCNPTASDHKISEANSRVHFLRSFSSENFLSINRWLRLLYGTLHHPVETTCMLHQYLEFSATKIHW